MPEKGSAYIPFVDGSRAMAHNLDRYREQWFLKLGIDLSDESQNQQRVVNFPKDFDAKFLDKDFTHFESLDEAKYWRGLLASEIAKIESWKRQSTKAIKTNRMKLSIADFAEQKFKEEDKKVELSYLKAALNCVRGWIEDNTLPLNRAREESTRKNSKTLVCSVPLLSFPTQLIINICVLSVLFLLPSF